MKIVILLVGVCLASAQIYDVLSLDAEGQLAMVQTRILNSIEQAAYNYARDEYCIETRESRSVAIPELFDFVVGTQSGGLAAALLSLKSEDGNVKYLAKDVEQVIAELGFELFLVRPMSSAAKAYWVLGAMTVGAAIAYLLARCALRQKKRGDSKMLLLFNDYFSLQGLEQNLDFKNFQRLQLHISSKKQILQSIEKELNCNNGGYSDEVKTLCCELRDVLELETKSDNKIEVEKHQGLLKAFFYEYECYMQSYEQRKRALPVIVCLGAVGGFLSMHLLGMGLLQAFYAKTIDPRLAKTTLSQFIDPSIQLSQSSLKTFVVLPAFDLYFNSPKIFYPGSPDLVNQYWDDQTSNESTNEKEALTPLSLLDCVIGGLADPFVYEPFLTPNKQLLISASINAPNPALSALQLVEELKQVSNAAEQIKLVSVGFDYSIQHTSEQ